MIMPSILISGYAAFSYGIILHCKLTSGSINLFPICSERLDQQTRRVFINPQWMHYKILNQSAFIFKSNEIHMLIVLKTLSSCKACFFFTTLLKNPKGYIFNFLLFLTKS